MRICVNMSAIVSLLSLSEDQNRPGPHPYHHHLGLANKSQTHAESKWEQNYAFCRQEKSNPSTIHAPRSTNVHHNNLT